MPLSASFHFLLSVSLQEENIIIELSLQSISSLFSYFLLYSPHPHSSPSHISLLAGSFFSAISVMLLPHQLNITKKRGFIWQYINILYTIIYLYEEEFSGIV